MIRAARFLQPGLLAIDVVNQSADGAVRAQVCRVLLVGLGENSLWTLNISSIVKSRVKWPPTADRPLLLYEYSSHPTLSPRLLHHAALSFLPQPLRRRPISPPPSRLLNPPGAFMLLRPRRRQSKKFSQLSTKPGGATPRPLT